MSLEEKKKGDMDTEEKPYKDGGRAGRDAAPSPGMPGAPRSWKRQEGLPPAGASAGNVAPSHLDLTGPAPPGSQILVSRPGGGCIPVARAHKQVAFC